MARDSNTILNFSSQGFYSQRSTRVSTAYTLFLKGSTVKTAIRFISWALRRGALGEGNDDLRESPTVFVDKELFPVRHGEYISISQQGLVRGRVRCDGKMLL
jgi:hypothetical protein